MQHSITESVRTGKISFLQIVVVASCVFMNAIDGVDVLAISFTAPSITREWHISSIQLGYVFGAGLIGMALGALLLGPIGDYIGRRPTILLNLLLMTIGMFATAAASTTTQLLIMRVLTGLGIGGILPGLNTLVAEYSPEKYKNFALSCFVVGYPIGAVVSSPIAAFLLREHGWRSIFIAGGCLSTFMITIVLLCVPESIEYYLIKRPKDALRKVNAILKRMNRPTVDALPAPAQKEEKKSERTAALEVLRGTYLYPTILLWMSFFFAFSTLYFVLNWVPTIIVDLGFTNEQGIYGNFWFNLGGTFGALLFGYLSSMTGLRIMTRIFLFAGAVGMSLFAISGGSLSSMYFGMLVAGFALLGVVTGLYSTSARMYPAKTRSSGVGMALGMGRFGAILGPFFAGYTFSWGWSARPNFYFFAVPLLITCVLFFFIHYDDPKTLKVF
jgi:AAHS family 4-hydroxybenzoate transporter-like MFS transporter